MPAFITLFVSIQLFLGFCALLVAMRQSPDGTVDESDLCRIKVRRD